MDIVYICFAQCPSYVFNCKKKKQKQNRNAFKVNESIIPLQSIQHISFNFTFVNIYNCINIY